MAFIDTKGNFNKVERNFLKQDIGLATYSKRDELFQINSYSNEDKLEQGNASQTIQFDLEGLKDLISIIKREFPNVEKKQGFVTTHNIFLPHPRNRIIFGAPGTGKSHLLEQERSQHFDDAHYERVTFHPNYSYSQFVGAYKPVALENEGIAVLDSNTKYILSILQDKNKTAQEKYDSLFDKFRDGNLTRLPVLLGLYTDENFETKKLDDSPASNDNNVERNHGLAIRPFVKLYSEKSSTSDITYAFVPGPFIRVLAKAMQKTSENFLLVIEEINRANVAAVFGDVFQLLDRDESGKSEYPIDAGEDLKNYLEGQGISLSDGKIAIPANMYIWATMNSADQGVMPRRSVQTEMGIRVHRNRRKRKRSRVL